MKRILTTSRNGSGEIGCVIVFFVIAFLIGWIANIVQVVMTIADPITGLFILKCVCILIAPVGSVLGWVGFFI